MEVLLMFKNPNMSAAKILLSQLDEREIEEEYRSKLTATVMIMTSLTFI